jgi:two-component system chemotaxis response regulator CheB
MIKELNPDVITLDVEMPHMNGLEFLEKIMRLRPMPVVMVSTLTQRGAEVTLERLSLARSIISPSLRRMRLLCWRLLDGTGREGEDRSPRQCAGSQGGAEHRPSRKPARRFQAVVTYGCHRILDGRRRALIEVLSHFPENCPPTLITQHMPAGFTRVSRSA